MENDIFAYHVTPSINIEKILIDGLLPQIGIRSKIAKEREPAIYLFVTLEAVETALLNWFGEEFEDVDKLTVLRVRVNQNQCIKSTKWELICHNPIDSKNISIIAEI